ncbi:hypothetical protein PpBr36_08854 [Pyricularia pennisetigena]|uniref:hypothetical protein n=1 Tax=Pyricularia pennisetigena TaxID=1578925 RepID=UPI0011510721|nr:hypothetical protein PpBr36_08854 [Pyricularia pennisetigena]TLS24045.1 hypothetical protein PpBr36_08854 [Pyricularia pennisetigena]
MAESPEPRPPSDPERQSAVDFFLRHVDNSPNISHARCLQKVKQYALATATGLALTGNTTAATRLVELLREHGLDPLQDLADSVFLVPAMYFAWEATASWPDWAPTSERTEQALATVETAARQTWLERFSEPYGVDEDTVRKALQMADDSINNAFPDVPVADRIRLAARWFDEGQYGFASNPMGPFSSRYITMQSWWRLSTYPYPWQQLFRSAGLVIALDVQLKLGRYDDAMETLRQICARITFTEQAFMLACSRAAWKSKLFTAGDGGDGRSTFMGVLDIDPTDLQAGGLRAVEMLEERLCSGPKRPFRNKNIKELTRILSANTFENCAYDELEIYGPPLERPEHADALLHSPCSEEDAIALERRLGTDLPPDYREFLSASDGMDPFWDGGFLLRLLAPAAEVCTVHLDFFDRDIMQLPLLRDQRTPIDWPPMPERAVSLSGPEAGGDGGDLWLIDRETTARCKEAFFAALDASSAEEKSVLQRAVEDVYGSMQRFRDLDRAVVGWTSWGHEFEAFDGVRGVLEVMAERSLHRLRPWDDCFRPGHRKVLL